MDKFREKNQHFNNIFLTIEINVRIIQFFKKSSSVPQMVSITWRPCDSATNALKVNYQKPKPNRYDLRKKLQIDFKFCK